MATKPIFFGGCDYLGLSKHPDVIRAACQAAADGLSAGASRTTTGDRPVYRELEEELAAFMEHEACALTVDGYLANVAACQTLRSLGIERAIADERTHASLIDGARTSGIQVSFFRHGNADEAGSLLAHDEQPTAILTDTVFTATGEIAPITKLLEFLRPSDYLILDECHAFTTIGGAGRGTCADLSISDARVIATTTLAKGLGCAGGAVLANQAFIGQLRRVASAYIGATPTPPPLAAAARQALRVLQDTPDLHGRLRKNATLVHQVLQDAGYRVSSPTTPIFAFTEPTDAAMESLDGHLRNHGIEIPLMSYPGGEAERYFRLAVTAQHTDDDIERLAIALKDRPITERAAR